MINLSNSFLVIPTVLNISAKNVISDLKVKISAVENIKQWMIQKIPAREGVIVSFVGPVNKYITAVKGQVLSRG